MENMQRYAARIGAEYLFDHNPNIAGKVCDVPMYFEWLNPLLDDRFLAYDRIAVLDMDVYTVEGLSESIFDEPMADVGICTEPHQPELRATLSGPICAKNDERWARAVRRLYGAELPRDEQGRLKVYNAGVVVFTRAGLVRARERFVPFQQYIDAMRGEGLPRFYTVDQNYFHAMMVAHLEYTEMGNGLNSYIHYVGQDTPRAVQDSRTADTRFVHIQLRGADDYDAETLWRITNRPQSEWRLP
jgi:hypothetical protein